MIDFSPALPAFVITLREGVEAALVVGIVLACLKKADQSQLNGWVYGGVGLGLAASLLVGGVFRGLLVSLQWIDRPDAAVAKPLLEGGFCLLAIAMLGWMLVWMTQQSSFLKAEITGAVTASLTASQGSKRGWGILGLIFIAVLREGFETVVFLLTQGQAGGWPVLGAIAGLVAAVLLGVLLFQGGIRINLGLFFQVMGVLLLFIVSGLVITALKDFDAALRSLSLISPQFAHLCPAGMDSACILGPLVWDIHAVLPDKQFPGVLLKTFLGYRDRLYLVQAIAYGLFLTTLGSLYFQSLNHRSAPKSIEATKPG